MRATPSGAALLLLVAVAGCSREVETDPSAVPSGLVPTDHGSAEASAVAAEPPAGEALASLSAVLYSEHDADVSARSAGVVKVLAAEMGDVVAAGELLAVLHDEAELAGLESARAGLELAELEHARAVQLRQREVITQAEFDQVAYRLRAARAAVQEAAVRLEYTRVRAPFAGTISRRFVRTAQSVERSAPLFRVTAVRPLRTQLRVPELPSRSLRPGQQIPLRGPGREEVRGVVLRVAPAVDAASGTVEVLLDVPDPAGLRPGSTVTVQLPVRR